MCKKKKWKRKKENVSGPLWTGSRHSDVAESTNVCLDFNEVLDTNSSVNFIISLEDECKANFALLGNLCENHDTFKYEYDLLLFKAS